MAPTRGNLKWCATTVGFHGLQGCDVTLLGALYRDEIPGYSYNASSAEECLYWVHAGLRHKDNAEAPELSHIMLARPRLLEPFSPPLRQHGAAIYVGAHRLGRDGVYLQRRHALRMHIFEPSPAFYHGLREALANRSEHFRVYNAGLGAKTGRAQLLPREEATLVIEGDLPPEMANHTVEVLMRDAAEVVHEISHGDGAREGLELLHMNCEGCEYDVIDALDGTMQLGDIAHIQLASHLLEHVDFLQKPTIRRLGDAIHASAVRYCRMHRQLSKTHKRVWGLPWVWERWSRMPPGQGEGLASADAAAAAR